MTSDIASPAERIAQVFAHLGVARAHVLACLSGDWGELAVRGADRLCSLTVVAPHLNKGVPDGLDAVSTPSLVIAGDQGAPATRARNLASRFGRGTLFEIAGYESPAWADTIADCTDDVADAVESFFAQAETEGGRPSLVSASGAGEVAGIRYRIDGQGPAVVLLPLSMAPSQWAPLVPRLAQRYAVVQLGGPHLGLISLLEERGQSGYGDLFADLLDRARPAAGETLLELGCGSGALSRALAKRMSGDCTIVATDINPYLLSEARALAEGEGLASAIRFEEANAEALPFPDAQFDIAFCSTVFEEGDAERMLAEMVRVTRPGGRIAVMTRAVDIDWWTNLAVPADLRRRLGAVGPSTGAGVGARGCADGSLYGRFRAVGLAPILTGPQFAIYRDGPRLDDVLDRLVSLLSPEDERICRDAIRLAEREGALLAGEPFHCAVATR